MTHDLHAILGQQNQALIDAVAAVSFEEFGLEARVANASAVGALAPSPVRMTESLADWLASVISDGLDQDLLPRAAKRPAKEEEEDDDDDDEEEDEEEDDEEEVEDADEEEEDDEDEEDDDEDEEDDEDDDFDDPDSGFDDDDDDEEDFDDDE